MANELRIRQLAVGGLVEDNPLTAGATLLTSAGLAGVSGGVGSTQHLPIVLDPDGEDGAPEIAYVTALTAGAGVTGSTGLLRGQEGTTGRAHVAGTPWVHAVTPRDVPRHTSIIRTSGLVVPSTSTGAWSAFDGSNLDLVISAYAGDVLELDMSFVHNSFSYYRVDVATIVAGSVTNYCSGGGSGGKGVSAWRTTQADSLNTHGGGTRYTVQSGDIVSGAVTLRPICQRESGSTATAPNFGGDSTQPLCFSVTNLGPPSV